MEKATLKKAQIARVVTIHLTVTLSILAALELVLYQRSNGKDAVLNEPSDGEYDSGVNMAGTANKKIDI